MARTKKPGRISTPTEKCPYFVIYYKGRKTTRTTRKLAESLLKKWQNEDEQNIIKDDISKLPIKIALSDWLAKNSELDTLKNQNSKNRNYQTAQFQVYPTVGNIQVGSLTSADIDNMILKLRKNGVSITYDCFGNKKNEKNRTYSDSTVKKAYELLKRFYCENNYLKYLKENPFLKRYRFDQKPKMQESVFTEDELNRIENVIQKTKKENNQKVPFYRLGQVFIILMTTGIRKGELLALKWDDLEIKNEKHYLRIDESVSYVKQESGEYKYEFGPPKNKKTRRIPLKDKTIKAIDKLKTINGNFDYICATSKNTLPHENNLNRMFDCILKEASIENPIIPETKRYKYSIHSFRHTFASILINDKNQSIAQVAQLLGHSSSDITFKYYLKPESEKLIDVINAL